MHRTTIPSLCLMVGFLVGCGGTETSGGGTSSSSSSSSSSNSSSSGSSSSSSGSGSSSGGGASCQPNTTSSLPGVSVEFTSTNCTFTLAEAAAGIQIDYEVVVANDVPNVHPIPQQTACGGPGPSLLFIFENLGGNGQNYCLCDLGLCMAPGPDPVTIPQGTYPASFTWDGKNWSGPSDFGAEKGPAFPPGDYTLTVGSKGTWANGSVDKDYDVTSTVTVHLVP